MNKTITVFVLLCILSLGSDLVQAKNNNSKTSEAQMINLKQTKPYCIGRYVVDIPAEAQPLNRYDQYDSFIIKVKNNATRQDFNAAIEKVRKEYTGRWYIAEDPPEQNVTSRLTKTIKAKTSRDPEDPFDVFGFVLDKSTLFLIEGNHSSTPKWTEGSNKAMRHVIQNLRYRPEHEIPKESGQCIYQGFIADDDQSFRHSKQTLGFRFKDYPTVVLRFDAETSSRPLALMITRIEKNLHGVGQSQRKTNKNNIRKGEKNTAHLTGQEWISVEKMKGKDGISALWEHTGTARNNKDPLIGFEVDSGYSSFGNDSSSLERAEALMLYESIIRSIRKF